MGIFSKWRRENNSLSRKEQEGKERLVEALINRAYHLRPDNANCLRNRTRSRFLPPSMMAAKSNARAAIYDAAAADDLDMLRCFDEYFSKEDGTRIVETCVLALREMGYKEAYPVLTSDHLSLVEYIRNAPDTMWRKFDTSKENGVLILSLLMENPGDEDVVIQTVAERGLNQDREALSGIIAHSVNNKTLASGVL